MGKLYFLKYIYTPIKKNHHHTTTTPTPPMQYVRAQLLIPLNVGISDHFSGKSNMFF